MEQSVPDNDILAPPAHPLGSDKPEGHPIMKGARHLLLRKLRNRDYESSLVLLAALVETRRFTTSFYWKVGKTIVQQCQPTSLIPYLESAIVGLRNHPKVEAMSDCLLEIIKEEGYDAFKDRITSALESDKFEKPALRKLMALVTYHEWKNEVDKKKKEQMATETHDWLKTAYGDSPSDRYIIKAFLEVLYEQVPRPDTVIKDVIALISIRSATYDPELLSIILHYGRAYVPDMILGLSNLCDQDPVADSRIAFDPLLKLMKAVKSTDPFYAMVTLGRAKVIMVRLNHGCLNRKTLDELDRLLEDVTKLRDDYPTLSADVIYFLSSAGLAPALERNSMMTDDPQVMEELEFMKGKLATLFDYWMPPLDLNTSPGFDP
ncbi:hypothetical protein [Absidia glauca]|uniref:Uncharacterized protein n=1 Tax=Absidia glauca TaxID=4829 RepID=A0A163KRL5_ABSGL|nr:hypothetical protein [Absidia glauca]